MVYYCKLLNYLCYVYKIFVSILIFKNMISILNIKLIILMLVIKIIKIKKYFFKVKICFLKVK